MKTSWVFSPSWANFHCYAVLPLPEVSASPIAAWSLLHRWNVLKREGIQVEVLRPFGQDMNFEANNLEPQFSTSRAMFERFGRQKSSQQQRTCLKNSSGILQNNFASYVGHPRICTSLLYPGPGPINTASSFAPSLRFHAKVGEIPATAVESHWLIGWYQ